MCTVREYIKVKRFYAENMIKCKHQCNGMLFMVNSQTRHKYFLIQDLLDHQEYQASTDHPAVMAIQGRQEGQVLLDPLDSLAPLVRQASLEKTERTDILAPRGHPERTEETVPLDHRECQDPKDRPERSDPEEGLATKDRQVHLDRSD
jgi:hypothetical protein